MDIQKGIDDLKRSVKDTVDDVKDGVHESEHRTNADSERLRREENGDLMTPGEKLESGITEGKERVQAEYDKTKRDVRDRT
jgi:hypothetical protein